MRLDASGYIYFRNIPKKYRHLVLLMSIRGAGTYGDPAYLTTSARFNDDSSTSYDYRFLYASNTDKYTTEGFGGTRLPIGFSTNSTYTASLFSCSKTTILNYSSNQYAKTTISLAGVKMNTSSKGIAPFIVTGYWRNNNPITSITIYSPDPTSSELASGSIVSMYGVI
jgi:hypothetical protein